MTNNKDPTAYDCTGCRFADPNGLVCDVCLRKILDEQRQRRTLSQAAKSYASRTNSED